MMKKMRGVFGVMMGLMLTSLLLMVTCVWAADLVVPEQWQSNFTTIFYPGNWTSATWIAIAFAIYAALSEAIGESNLKENSVVRFIMNCLKGLFAPQNKQLLLLVAVGGLFTGTIACATYNAQQSITEQKVIAYEKAGSVLVGVQMTLQPQCDSGVITPDTCSKLKVTYNRAREAYIEAGEAGMAKINAIDSTTRAVAMSKERNALIKLTGLIDDLQQYVKVR